MALRIRRGTNAERQTIIFAEGELIYTTDTKQLYIGDGTTTGGIVAGGGAGGTINIIDDLTPQLGGNLDLNNNEINGTGDIDITGTIAASVISGGIFVGDGSGLTNLSEGIVEGSNYKINIVGDDSSLLVDSNNGTLVGRINNELVQTTKINLIRPLDPQERSAFRLETTTEGVAGPVIDFNANRTSNLSPTILNDGDTIIDLVASGYDGVSYTPSSVIKLGVDRTVTVDENIVPGKITFLTYNQSGTTGLTNGMVFNHQGRLGINTDEPQEKLDVRGNAIVNGNVSLSNGSLLLDNTQGVLTLPSPTKGQLTYDTTTDNVSYYDGGQWYNLAKTQYNTGFTIFPGPVAVGRGSTVQRDLFGEDSSLITGGMFYNNDDDRFQFYQAGSWVSLINNGGTIGQLLAWNGTEWAAVDPEITQGTIENANTLNGFNGSYYLDYNNFTNTPTLFDGNFSSLTNIPTTLAGYGITDAATSAQGLLADTALQPADVGSFTFTGSVLDTNDSSLISVTPAVTFNSDVVVENSLTVTNKITVDTLEVANLITTPTAGTPEISSDGAILLTAATRVEVSSSPLKMASFTTAERDGLSAENGDMIYNTTTNKFQGYAGGTWVDLH